MDKQNRKNRSFKRDIKYQNKFTIKHFARDVKYTIDGFIEKNRDDISGNIKATFQKSKMALMKMMFPSEESTVNVQARSIASGFRHSLNKLMVTLEKTSPYYVKCIKPNHFKRHGEFNGSLVLDQLQSTSVVESLEITQ